jgi:hypothetical protein
MNLSTIRNPHSQVTFLCPHCCVLSLHTTMASAEYEDKLLLDIPDDPDVPPPLKLQVVCRVKLCSAVMCCVNCQKHSYLLVRLDTDPLDLSAFPASPKPGVSTITKRLTDPAVVYRYPVSTPVTHAAVPSDVQSAGEEAEKCLAVGAYNACGVMCRRAMHSLCKDKGGMGGDLYGQLKILLDNQTIAVDIWQWAEELRVLGRNGAHPEWENISADDAQYGVNFLQEIIRYVYINPHQRSLRRLKETSKKR